MLREGFYVTHYMKTESKLLLGGLTRNNTKLCCCSVIISNLEKFGNYMLKGGVEAKRLETWVQGTLGTLKNYQEFNIKVFFHDK